MFYSQEELDFLRNLKGEVYTLPLGYDPPELAQKVLCGDHQVDIRPLREVSLDQGELKTLSRGYQLEVEGTRSCFLDSEDHPLPPKNPGLTTTQCQAILLGRALGETEAFLQYLLGSYVLLTHGKLGRERVVVKGDYVVGEVIVFPVDRWARFDIAPLSRLSLTREIVGKTEAIYDQGLLNRARQLSLEVDHIMIGLVCIMAEKNHAEFRVLGDEDGIIVLFNAKFIPTEKSYSLEVSLGEHVLMSWSPTARMGHVKYAPFYCINQSAREAYLEQKRRKNE